MTTSRANHAEENETRTPYRRPPEEIAAVVEAPLPPVVRLSPDRSWMLLLERPPHPSIAELAEPELRLAGLRLNPRTNGPSRNYPWKGLAFESVDGVVQRPVTGLPYDPRIGSVSWSPDGKRIAFTLTHDDAIELWGAEREDGVARRLTPHPLNAATGSPFGWLPDGERLLCAIIPEDRGSAPEEPRAPEGPVVHEHLGGKAPNRTYQDLLSNPYDEALFEYYVVSQIAIVDWGGGTRTIGAPGLYVGLAPSPDGRFMLVEALHPPFSYRVPYHRFPHTLDIRDLDGHLVRRIADNPMAEHVPLAFGSVPTGPRSAGWRSDASAEVYWVEALDGGDAGVESELRDEIFTLSEPFTAAPTSFLRLSNRFGSIVWGNERLALVSDWWWKTRRQRMYGVDPSRPGAEPRLLIDHMWEDRYNDPGSPMMRLNASGKRVLHLSADGRSIFMRGEGASSEGNRPFVDRFDLETAETERLWRSEPPYYEEPVALLDETSLSFITRRESPNEFPNYFVRTLTTSALRPLTEHPHPFPQLRDIRKEIIRYERSDGVKLTGTLYLPPGYDAERDGPLPAILWAYPQEFKNADATGQVTDSPYRFVWVGWWNATPFLTQGYAVLDNPMMPIVGEGDAEPNDTFIEQLASSAEAAVDELVRLGVGDRDRMAIGGHSYGAFMTANLLAHTRLFRAGIARSGAYNRTLTPFGFQAEDRTFWEAPETYVHMSPFIHADKIEAPLLLIHGEADNNLGSWAMQSERLYEALKGLGGTTRLVLLPHESHSYQANESLLHVMWETWRWLERYVKEVESER